MSRPEKPSRPPRRRPTPGPGWTAGRRPDTRLPPEVRKAFGDYLRKRFPKARGKRLSESVAELSDLFTSRRAELPFSYLNRPPVRSAYLAYFHPLQVLRGISAIAETRGRARRRGLFPDPADRSLEILDLGVGMGALSQAWLVLAASGQADRWPNFTFVDHQKSAVQDAKELTERVARALVPDREPPVIRGRTERIGDVLASPTKRRPDVVLMGGVWNERDDDWEPLLDRLLRVVAPHTLVVIVEPAIPEIGRKLMAMREAFLPATTTVAPCTHGKACPLLALRKDWCFTTHKAQLPGPVRVLAEGLHHQTEEVRYAGWSFVARPEAAPFELPEATHGRVVTDVMQGVQVLCVDGETVRRAAPRGAPARGTLVSRG